MHQMSFKKKKKNYLSKKHWQGKTRKIYDCYTAVKTQYIHMPAHPIQGSGILDS